MKTLSKRHRLIANMPYAFLHFLIKENILNLYVVNVTNNNTDNAIENLINSFNYFSYRKEFITSAFTWYKTTQGHNYWKAINRKWYNTFFK